jgi:two-component system nitrogen regulation response regulator GlnG
MIYLEQMHRHSDKAVRATLSIAQANGWRVAAGTYPSVEQPELRHAFIQLDLRPLRERPKSLRPLARLYLESYQKRLGLPKRRITPRLWKKLEAHHWPGNLRELESFIVQAVTSARGPSLSPDHLPRRVLALLDPDHATYAATDAYETIVEERLRDLVSGFKLHPDSPDLYRIVIDSTERALFRLVLNRTAGNQKAAAQLLGLARNTLRTRLQRLDPYLED